MSAVPSGYWLAPVEPTDAMIKAWANAGPTFPVMHMSDLDTICARADRSAMRDAAPPAPVAQPDTTAALVEALEDLESTATVVTNFGAQTGAQWLRMMCALIKTRAVLAAHRSAQTGGNPA